MLRFSWPALAPRGRSTLSVALAASSLAAPAASADAALAGQGAPAPQAGVQAVAARLAPEIRRAMVEGRIPSVAVALTDRQGELWSAAFGQSNLWARTPATTQTVYLIGSTFKAQSTVALLQQMEQGKFGLDDPVRDHLEDLVVRGEDPNDPVRFRHLLTHTSGMPVDFGPHAVWGDTSPLSLDAYLRDSLRVESPPLEGVVYSNMAYSLVGPLGREVLGQALQGVRPRQRVGTAGHDLHRLRPDARNGRAPGLPLRARRRHRPQRARGSAEGQRLAGGNRLRNRPRPSRLGPLQLGRRGLGRRQAAGAGDLGRDAHAPVRAVRGRADGRRMGPRQPGVRPHLVGVRARRRALLRPLRERAGLHRVRFRQQDSGLRRRAPHQRQPGAPPLGRDRRLGAGPSGRKSWASPASEGRPPCFRFPPFPRTGLGRWAPSPAWP